MEVPTNLGEPISASFSRVALATTFTTPGSPTWGRWCWSSAPARSAHWIDSPPTRLTSLCFPSDALRRSSANSLRCDRVRARVHLRVSKPRLGLCWLLRRSASGLPARLPWLSALDTVALLHVCQLDTSAPTSPTCHGVPRVVRPPNSTGGGLLRAEIVEDPRGRQSPNSRAG